MKSRLFLSLVITLALLSASGVSAQQAAKKIPRIGYLVTSSPSGTAARNEAFRQGLRELGYEDGKNIAIEWRYAGGKIDRLPALAAELVQLNVDVIVTGANPPVDAVRRQTSTLPIVMTFGNDPVGTGLVASLAQPGGNLTGWSIDTGDEFLGKRLELMKETTGNPSRLAVLYNGANAGHQLALKNLAEPARALKLSLLPVAYREPSDFEKALSSMSAKKIGGVVLFSDGLSFNNRELIAQVAIKHRLPTGFPAAEYLDAGGLSSYGPDLVDLCRRSASYVVKILNGRKPAELPVEQPKKFEFIVDLKAAKQIGLTVPPNVLARADRVIR